MAGMEQRGRSRNTPGAARVAPAGPLAKAMSAMAVYGLHPAWLLVFLPALVLADAEFELDAVEWARPRSAEAVVAMPTVRDAVHTWSQIPAAEMVIRHPRGETGMLWAEELRDWLVALGVPSHGIRLSASSRLEERVRMTVRRSTGGEER